MCYFNLEQEFDRQNRFNKNEGLPSAEEQLMYYMKMINNTLFVGKNKIVLQDNSIVVLNNKGKPCYRTLHLLDALNKAKTLNTR